MCFSAADPYPLHKGNMVRLEPFLKGKKKNKYMFLYTALIPLSTGVFNGKKKPHQISAKRFRRRPNRPPPRSERSDNRVVDAVVEFLLFQTLFTESFLYFIVRHRR